MDILTQLEQWKAAGAISGSQFDAIGALVRRDRFSVFVELKALLDIGVLALVAGLGWTMSTYSARLGDTAIVSFLTGTFFWSLYYCFDRALPGRMKMPAAGRNSFRRQFFQHQFRDPSSRRAYSCASGFPRPHHQKSLNVIDHGPILATVRPLLTLETFGSR